MSALRPVRPACTGAPKTGLPCTQPSWLVLSPVGAPKDRQVVCKRHHGPVTVELLKTHRYLRTWEVR